MRQAFWEYQVQCSHDAVFSFIEQRTEVWNANVGPDTDAVVQSLLIVAIHGVRPPGELSPASP